MKKKLSISSFIAAIIVTVWGAETGCYIPALISIGYALFWLWANKKAPGRHPEPEQKPLYLYDITSPFREQGGKTA